MLNLLSEYTDNILKSLEVTWKGLLAIGIVVALCVCATTIMIVIDKKSSSAAAKNKKSEEDLTDKQ